MASSADHGENEIRLPLTQFVRELADQVATTSGELAAKRVLKEHVDNCPVAREFHDIKIDLYGIPGNKTDRSPGLMGDVADLKYSRKILTRGLRAVWLVIVAIVGAIANSIWRG